MKLLVNLPIAVIIALICSQTCADASYRSKIKEANKLYGQGKYDQAQKIYLDMEIEHPGNPDLSYNIANTFYRQKKYDEAIEYYNKTIPNAGPDLEAKSKFNIGNSLYNKGLQAEQSGQLDKAVDSMKEAIEHYKNALSKNPDDQDIKYNLEFVQSEIKRILDKAKEQAQKQQQQGQEGQQGQQGQQQQEGQQGQQQERQQGENNERENEGMKSSQGQQGAEKENEGKPQPAVQERENEADNESRDNEKKQKGELSKREAQQLLKNIPETEKKRRQAPERGYLGEVEKNW